MEFIKCTSCNAICCSKAGAVMITKEDINNLAKCFNIMPTEARTLYTHKSYDKVDGFISYLNKVNINDEYSSCIFKGPVKVGGISFTGCVIYEHRPEICRMYSASECTSECCL